MATSFEVNPSTSEAATNERDLDDRLLKGEAIIHRNVLWALGAGVLPSLASPTLSFPMVATKDIAMMAASYLLCDSWRGHHIVGVHGPKDLTQNQVVVELSRVLGQAVRYQQVPVEAAKQAMLGFGMPDFAVNIVGEMYQAIVDGRMNPVEPRTPHTTTATTLREFIGQVIKPALAQLKSGAGGGSAS